MASLWDNEFLDSVADFFTGGGRTTYKATKKIEKAGIMGAASGFGLEVFRQIKSDEDPDVSKAVKEGLKGGADQGLKAAAAAAIKVAAEKGCLKKYTKGVSSETCSNIAFIGIENAKTLIKLGEGKISTTEANDQIATTTIAAVTGICLAKKFKKAGEKIGEKFGEIALKKIPVIGEVISPYAAKVGGLVGGLIGSAAGKYIAEPLYTGAKKAVDFAKDVANNLIGKVKSTGKKVLGHSKAKA